MIIKINHFTFNQKDITKPDVMDNLLNGKKLAKLILRLS